MCTCRGTFSTFLLFQSPWRLVLIRSQMCWNVRSIVRYILNFIVIPLSNLISSEPCWFWLWCDCLCIWCPYGRVPGVHIKLQQDMFWVRGTCHCSQSGCLPSMIWFYLHVDGSQYYFTYKEYKYIMYGHYTFIIVNGEYPHMYSDGIWLCSQVYPINF